MAERQRVTIFTDGACTGNPGPGGYAAILVCGTVRKEVSGGRRLTTNNRMEIMAAIAALESLTRTCDVTVYSDSRYLVDAIELGWAAKWQANGWKRNRKEYAVNTDLWGRLLALCAIHSVRFAWVRGHDGHAENERCDELAVAATKDPAAPADAGYETTQNEKSRQAVLF